MERTLMSEPAVVTLISPESADPIGQMVVSSFAGGPVPGRVLQSAAPLAKAVTEALEQAGRSGSNLVRIVSNAGEAVPFDSLAKAAGGGARGFIRGSNGGIREGVKLIPVGKLSVVAPRMLAASATLALDVIATQQQMAMLTEIRKVVLTMRAAEQQKRRAQVSAAAEALDDAAAQLVDGGVVGPETGLDTAIFATRTIYGEAAQVLDGLNAQRSSLQGQRHSYARLREAFDGIALDGGQFWDDLAFVRAALALRRRATLLQSFAAERAQESDYVMYLQRLQRRLAETDALVIRVDEFEEWLQGIEVTVRSFGRVSAGINDEKPLELQRRIDRYALHRAVQSSAAPPQSAVLDGLGGVALTIVRNVDGSLVLPASEPRE
jgi:hypothetical protein